MQVPESLACGKYVTRRHHILQAKTESKKESNSQERQSEPIIAQQIDGKKWATFPIDPRV
jgi:hypothetical protein